MSMIYRWCPYILTSLLNIKKKVVINCEKDCFIMGTESAHQNGQSSSKNLLWVCEKNAKLIAVLELFEYVMRW